MSEAEYGGFAVIRPANGAAARRAAGRLAALAAESAVPGEQAIHLSVDESVIVYCVRWAAAPGTGPSGPHEDVLRALSADPSVGSVRTFAGTLAASVDGPAAAEPPGAAVLAIRHVRDHATARDLAGLLARSGDWKRDFPGFVGAAAYVSDDGTDYVNYPRWTDEERYHAYMADPRNARDQPSIASLETAKPEMIRCGPALAAGGPGA